MLAGFWIFAGIDFGMAGKEVSCQLVNILPPIDECFSGEAVFDEAAGGGEAGKQGGSSVANVAREGLVAAADFGEDETAEEFFFVDSEAGVEGELHVVGAGKLPGPGRNCAGFVVDDEEGVIGEAIDAVEAEIEGEAGKLDGALDLGFNDLEFDAGGLVVEPLSDEACEALLFEFEIAAGQAVAEAREEFLL